MNFDYNDLTVAKVNLDYIKDNINLIKSHYPNQKFLLPVKANGYGHGAYEIAKIAEECGVDYLGVANIVEAEYLIKSGITTDIMILGLSPYQHIPAIVKYGVTATAGSFSFLEKLSYEAKLRGKTAKVHIKVDTGMGRIGVAADAAVSLMEQASDLSNIEIEGIFTHLSSADMNDELSREYTLRQFNVFIELLNKLEQAGLLPELRHISNSAGIVNFSKQTQHPLFNMIRPGIIVYGYPCEPYFKNDSGTRLAQAIKIPLSLYTHITGIRHLPAGSFISYGRTYKLQRATHTAVLSIGYADGFNRWLSNKGEVLVNGSKCRVLGRICMDQTVVDIDDISDVKIGQEVTVIGSDNGNSITCRDIAREVGTITYEILTMLSKRVKRIYIRGGETMSYDIKKRAQVAAEMILEDEGFADEFMTLGEDKGEKLYRKCENEAAALAKETAALDDEKAAEYLGRKVSDLKKKYRELIQNEKKK